MIWGLGNFGGVSLQQLPVFSAVTCWIWLRSVAAYQTYLNALLLGPRYAENLGVNIRRIRNLLLIATGLLTAVTTSFCGPVAFIGLAVPHIARLMLGTSNHNSLLPVTLLTGSAMALLCNLICVMPGEAGIITPECRDSDSRGTGIIMLSSTNANSSHEPLHTHH